MKEKRDPHSPDLGRSARWLFWAGMGAIVVVIFSWLFPGIYPGTIGQVQFLFLMGLSLVIYGGWQDYLYRRKRKNGKDV